MTRGTARGLLPLAALSLSLALLGAGCSDPGEEVTTTGGSPGGRDDPLFVSIEVGGGFVPQGHDFRQIPTAVIYSDGQAFTGGAITLQYPGPAVLPVTSVELTDAQVEDILEAAEKAGLTEPGDYGQPWVADAPTTTITVVTDGETHTASIEALQEATMDPARGESQPPPGMREEAVEARRKAREFVDFVGSLLGPNGEQHEPDRYRVFPMAIATDQPVPEGDPEAGPEPQPQEKDWPFAHIALVENECVAVTGPDAVTFRQTLREANEITRWKTQSGQVFNLAVRPVLPHEPDCPEAEEPAAQE